MAAIVLTGILVLTLIVQARFASVRMLVVLTGAGAASLASALFGFGGSRELLAEVPWDVLVLLVTLGLLSEAFVEARLFAVVAVRAAELSRASPVGVALVFGGAMYVVSALMNNLTALVLVLPIVLIILRVAGAGQRQVSWTLGSLLVACNLGGAATPIGDFPAILLLGRGSMTFTSYLFRAAPTTFVGTVAVLVVAALALRRTARGRVDGALRASISRALLRSLYRGVRLDRKLLGWITLVFLVMLVSWTFLPASGAVSPDLVAWLGVLVALAARPAFGERIIRTRVDVEAVLFLLALFVMVAAVRRTGVFGLAATTLTTLPVSPPIQLVLFLLLVGIVTGLFSAGPSMAALLEVAAALATRLPPNVVYVGLALAVCAGSSLFLTAATSGPLAQSLTERAQLVGTDGKRIRFGFVEFLPIGALSFVIIEVVAIGYCLIGLFVG
ncbi:MAG TPA: SLC13 family permease [Labilithrix sp.]|nr:SLC13 family permease [Labilithrix sp.]